MVSAVHDPEARRVLIPIVNKAHGQWALAGNAPLSPEVCELLLMVAQEAFEKGAEFGESGSAGEIKKTLEGLARGRT